MRRDGLVRNQSREGRGELYPCLWTACRPSQRDAVRWGLGCVRSSWWCSMEHWEERRDSGASLEGFGQEAGPSCFQLALMTRGTTLPAMFPSLLLCSGLESRFKCPFFQEAFCISIPGWELSYTLFSAPVPWSQRCSTKKALAAMEAAVRLAGKGYYVGVAPSDRDQDLGPMGHTGNLRTKERGRDRRFNEDSSCWPGAGGAPFKG